MSGVLLDPSECSPGFESDVNSTCIACTGNTYKAEIGNTPCLDLPPGTSVTGDLVLDGGNAGFSKYTPRGLLWLSFVCSYQKGRLEEMSLYCFRV